MEGVKVTQSGRSPTQLVPAGLYTQKRDRASGGELSRDGDKTNKFYTEKEELKTTKSAI